MKLLALIVALLPVPALAHPHIFIDARVQVVFDPQGRASGIAMEWVYDDLFSLLLAEEVQVDADADGVLTEDEQRILSDFVTDWPPVFDGDLFVTQDGQPLRLAPPRDHVARMQRGRVIETHLRPFMAPLEMRDPLAIQVYDPGFYTAYDLVSGADVGGRAGCSSRVDKADIVAANEMVEQLLGGLAAADIGPEEAFPEVGHVFADTVWVTCDAS